MTKCGRYGLNQSEFDYSPETIRKSVERSLERFHTTYLDTVYLHDVEFVSTPVGPLEAGNPETALFEKTAEYGLAEGQESKVWGQGDQKILDAYAELRKMQEEGKIKYIGMTGENVFRWKWRICGILNRRGHSVHTLDASPPCASRAPHAAVQARRRPPLVLPPLAQQQHLRDVRQTAPRAREGHATRHRVSSYHGSPYAQSAIMAPRPGKAKGRSETGQQDRQRCPVDGRLCEHCGGLRIQEGAGERHARRRGTQQSARGSREHPSVARDPERCRQGETDRVGGSGHRGFRKLVGLFLGFSP